MPLERHRQGLPQSLGGKRIDDDPLGNRDRDGRDAEGLGIEAEVDDQLLRRAGDAAEVGIQGARFRVVDGDLLGRGLVVFKIRRGFVHGLPLEIGENVQWIVSI